MDADGSTTQGHRVNLQGCSRHRISTLLFPYLQKEQAAKQRHAAHVLLLGEMPTAVEALHQVRGFAGEMPQVLSRLCHQRILIGTSWSPSPQTAGTTSSPTAFPANRLSWQGSSPHPQLSSSSKEMPACLRARYTEKSNLSF